MIDRQELLALIKVSHSLSQSEKEKFYSLIPLFKEKDAAYFYNVFKMEEKVWKDIPYIETAIEKGLEDMFHQTAKGYGMLQKHIVREAESDQKNKDVSHMNNKLNNL